MFELDENLFLDELSEGFLGVFDRTKQKSEAEDTVVISEQGVANEIKVSSRFTGYSSSFTFALIAVFN